MRRIDPLEKLYFQWLCKKIKDYSYHDRENLLWYLYKKDFYGHLPNDDNRVADAINLRDHFEAENDTYISDILRRKPASMLEMLISLAERMDYELYDPNKRQVEKWFNILIENLGLSDDYENNDLIIDIFIKRKYKADGTGGLFPLKKPGRDQRKIEIWYQLHQWLAENDCF